MKLSSNKRKFIHLRSRVKQDIKLQTLNCCLIARQHYYFSIKFTRFYAHFFDDCNFILLKHRTSSRARFIIYIPLRDYSATTQLNREVYSRRDKEFEVLRVWTTTSFKSNDLDASIIYQLMILNRVPMPPPHNTAFITVSSEIITN